MGVHAGWLAGDAAWPAARAGEDGRVAAMAGW